MSDNNNRDEAAFAIPSSFGLTKREYFAAAILSGTIGTIPVHQHELIVQDAVRLADVLLAELAKGAE